MCKSQFTRWGLRENYKASQKKQLAQAAKSYRDLGRPIPALKFGNRPAKLHRVRRFCKEQNIMADLCDLPIRPELTIMNGSSAQPPLETSLAGAVFNFDRPFSLNSGIGCIELVLLQTRNYLYLTKSSNDLALLQSSRLLREHPRHLQGLSHVIEELRNKLVFGVGLLAQGKFRTGWKCIDETCQLFHEVLHRPHVHLVRTLLNAFGKKHWFRFPELKAHMFSFFAKACMARLGCHHPLSVLLFHLHEEATFTGAIEPAYKFLMTSFEERGDLTPDEVWQLKNDFIQLLIRRGDYATAAAYTRQFLNENEKWWGRTHRFTRPLLHLLAFSHYRQGLLELAAAECENLIEQGQKLANSGEGEGFLDATGPGAYQVLAWVSEFRGDLVRSEKCWRAVLSGSLEIWGPGKDITSIYVGFAEQSLSKQGVNTEKWLQQNFCRRL